MEQIQQALPGDRRTKLWVNKQSQVKTSKFELKDGILRFQGRVYVPQVKELR